MTRSEHEEKKKTYRVREGKEDANKDTQEIEGRGIQLEAFFCLFEMVEEKGRFLGTTAMKKDHLAAFSAFWS